ncbi:hypothetical protein AGMMS50255_4370 [Spirochaetia bacterium]|nr:hypothetical protein AGMMS50255_4370 [Spirochaetia bacterium]
MRPSAAFGGESAFRSLEQRMEQPPCYYSLGAITKFTNKQGGLLLGKYSPEELEAYIRKRTTESVNNEAPDWLIIQDGGDERWFIQKDKYLPLAGNMLTSVRLEVKGEITDRWTKMIRDFDHEEAMDSDTEFDRLLTTRLESVQPMLMIVLKDEKLFMVYEEMERSPEGVPASLRIFDDDKLLPMSILLQLNRRELFLDAKITLPFWYSIPVLIHIIAFFSSLGKKKKQKTTRRKKTHINDENEAQNAGQQEPSSDMVQAAREIEALIVPQGRSLDEYLTVMEGRWGGILKNAPREQLVREVNALVREHLRQILQLRKNAKITQEILEEVSKEIIPSTPSLNNLRDKNALKHYMELYMVKLLLTGNA